MAMVSTRRPNSESAGALVTRIATSASRRDRLASSGDTISSRLTCGCRSANMRRGGARNLVTKISWVATRTGPARRSSAAVVRRSSWATRSATARAAASIRSPSGVST